MNPYSKVLSGVALALAGAAAVAHGGHATAPGVPPSGHVHLWDGLTVGPQWLVLPGLALALALAAISWRRGRGPARRRATADDARRGSRRASR